MPEGALLGNLLLFALPVLLIVWMIMSQRRRQKAMQNVQSSLSVGDEVITTAGMYGRVVRLEDSDVVLDAGNGTLLRFDRRAIAGPAPDRAGAGAAQPPTHPTQLSDATPESPAQDDAPGGPEKA